MMNSNNNPQETNKLITGLNAAIQDIMNMDMSNFQNTSYHNPKKDLSVLELIEKIEESRALTGFRDPELVLELIKKAEKSMGISKEEWLKEQRATEGLWYK